MTDKTVLLIVPWWRKLNLEVQDGTLLTVVHPFESVAQPKNFDLIMVDVNLKNDWAEEVDDWFFAEIVKKLPPKKRNIMWCRESSDAET